MKSAGQASARETNRLKLAIKVSKTVTAIAIFLSINSIATAVDWVRALQYQLESWSGAIAGGSLGIEVGSVVDGPVIAVFGSIIGSIFGGIGAVALGNWYFAGSSKSRALDYLLVFTIQCYMAASLLGGLVFSARRFICKSYVILFNMTK